MALAAGTFLYLIFSIWYLVNMQEGAKKVKWKVIWLCLQLPSPFPQGRASPGQEVDLIFQFDLCTFNLG